MDKYKYFKYNNKKKKINVLIRMQILVIHLKDDCADDNGEFIITNWGLLE